MTSWVLVEARERKVVKVLNNLRWPTLYERNNAVCGYVL